MDGNRLEKTLGRFADIMEPKIRKGSWLESSTLVMTDRKERRDGLVTESSRADYLRPTFLRAADASRHSSLLRGLPDLWKSCCMAQPGSSASSLASRNYRGGNAYEGLPAPPVWTWYRKLSSTITNRHCVPVSGSLHGFARSRPVRDTRETTPR
jgi:hypothetical protein